MTERDADSGAMGDEAAIAEVSSADMQRWVQAHRTAAQAAVATVLGVRVLSLELHDGPPPLGVVHLGEPESDEAGPLDHGRVRMLTYRITAPIAERMAGDGGVTLQGEPAYYLATTVLAQMREPDSIDEANDIGSVARLLLDHFGDRVDDAAEAAEHLAMNVEAWVSEHWGAIAVVAANLLRYRHLTGDGVRQLMPPMQPGPLV
jgi:hypothetical protein